MQKPKVIEKIKLKLPYLTNTLNNIKNVGVINNRLVNLDEIGVRGLEYLQMLTVLRILPSN